MLVQCREYLARSKGKPYKAFSFPKTVKILAESFLEARGIS